MKLNSFQLLLKQRYDTYEAVAKLLRAAVSAGAFPDHPSALTAAYYSEPLKERIGREVRLPGTRGGLLWRYFVTTGTWLADLARVNELLGQDARTTVQRLGRPSKDVQMPESDRSIAVIRSALTSDGFKQYVQARFGEGNTVLAQEYLTTYLLNPSAAVSAAETVDFLTHLFVQDFELVDLARVPDVQESLALPQNNAPFWEARYGLRDDADTSLDALARIAQSLTSQRKEIRREVAEKLASDGILRSLVLSRLLPFVESHFLVTNPQVRRGLPAGSLASLVIEQDYLSRFPNDPTIDFSRVPSLGAADALTKRTAQVLSHASVPFLYWCAKSHIPLARLWNKPGNEPADKISIWPEATDHDWSGKYVAIASKLDTGSFFTAMRFLTQTLHRYPESLCLFVTDHWNEEEAAAAYQVVTNPRSPGSIVVLRSDGTRYPISVFAFPAQ